MQGTLDDPPIVIRQDRHKIFLLLLVCLVLAAVSGTDLFESGARDLAWHGFVVATLLACAAMVAWNLAHPGSLTLDRNGLTWKNMWRSFRYDWNEFDGFEVYAPVAWRQWPGCVFSAAHRKQRQSQLPTSGRGSFGGNWEMKAKDVVALLNEARRRWS